MSKNNGEIVLGLALFAIIVGTAISGLIAIVIAKSNLITVKIEDASLAMSECARLAIWATIILFVGSMSSAIIFDYLKIVRYGDDLYDKVTYTKYMWSLFPYALIFFMQIFLSLFIKNRIWLIAVIGYKAKSILITVLFFALFSSSNFFIYLVTAGYEKAAKLVYDQLFDHVYFYYKLFPDVSTMLMSLGHSLKATGGNQYLIADIYPKILIIYLILGLLSSVFSRNDIDSSNNE